MIIEPPYAAPLGMAAASLERWEEATDYFKMALATAEKMGARPHAALIRVAWGSALRDGLRAGTAPWSRGAPAEAALRESSELFDTARGAAMELGAPGLVALIEAELAKPVAPVSRPPVEAAPLQDAPPFELRREGEYWTVSCRGGIARIKDSRGMHMLAQLIDAPGREYHALTLASDMAGDLLAGDAGEVLDRDAVAAYRARLEDLEEALREATQYGDHARALRAREEMDAIAEELARGIGLGGRARRAGSAAERARVNVQKRLRTAIGHIAKALPELGRHLSWAVKTGSYVSYDPRR
jgi:hypothetical protein